MPTGPSNFSVNMGVVPGAYSKVFLNGKLPASPWRKLDDFSPLLLL
jgi:hypothetical protein